MLAVLIFLISSPSKAQPTLCPGFGFRAILSIVLGFFVERIDKSWSCVLILTGGCSRALMLL